jgi:hypothetical protein
MSVATRRDVQTDGVQEGAGFDELVKGLAAGTISRKRAIGLLGSTLLGAVVPIAWRSGLVSAQGELCTACTRMSETGLCSTINDSRPFQSCCADSSTLTTPGVPEPTDCSCVATAQQDRRGGSTVQPGCVPTDQTCRQLEKCHKRNPRCGGGRVCVLGSCCNTPAEFARDIGICAQTGKCEPVGIGTVTGASSSRRGATLTRPA